VSAQRSLERFAFVAATNVLASLAPSTGIALALLITATAAWCALLPEAIGAQRGPAGRRARHEARGSWLLAVVATESLAVTAAEVGRRTASPGIVALAAGWWVLGLGLYALVLSILIARLPRHPLTEDDLAGDHWIVMGALAISALAGSRVYAALTARRLDHWLLPIAHAGALACWVAALCCLPLLASLECRHGASRTHYRAARWSTVFPLGMLAAASHALAATFAFEPGRWLFDLFVWIAAAAWVAASFGFVRLASQWARR
jgi:tellurite resistance protein TehA-like permease